MTTPGIPGFTRLDAITSLYRPNGQEDGKHDPTQLTPSLVIFCSWMGAAPKNISKYTRGYQRLFPNATVLLVESRLLDVMTRPNLSVATETLESLISSLSPSQTGPSIVAHCCSNGGMINIVTIATRLKTGSRPVLIDRLILDCAPGRVSVASAVAALSFSIPDVLYLRTVVAPLIYTLFASLKVLHFMGLGVDKVSWVRETTNNPSTFPRNTKRLYVYSRADALVHHEHVHEHAEEARAAGYSDVRELMFDHAAHCALITEAPESYWSAIEAHVRGAESSL